MKNEYTIGIDLGGTRLKAAMVDSEGLISHEIIEASRVKESYNTVLTHLVDIVNRIRDSIFDKNNPIKSVGFGIAGLMNESRRVVIASPNCPSIVNRGIADDLERLTSLPVCMDNDTNMMALGEGFSGAAKGCKHFIAITIGTGIGGAIVMNNQIIRGVDGGGGEIGHIAISRRGPKCGCGSYGCLEAYIGKIGIKHYVETHQPHLRKLGLVDISQRANNGDKGAIQVYRYLGQTLGIGLSSVVNLCNPEMIVIGGGVAAAGEILFEPVRKELSKRTFKAYQINMSVHPALLGNWAGVIGAAIEAKRSLK